MLEPLSPLIFLAGIAQLMVLVASALVPIRLRWKTQLACLPRLHRQMYWVYGGYVVLATIAFGTISIFFARELASGEPLARALCCYISVFWGIRLGLQGFLDARPYLVKWWLRIGYHALTGMFLAFTLIYGWAAVGPAK